MSAETNPRFPRTFFAGLAESDDRAMAVLREAAFPDGSAPSPRAEAFYKSGEWDRRDLMDLVLVHEEACCGVIAASRSSPYLRICPQVGCSIAAHQNSRKTDIQLPAWFISGGVRSNSGVFAAFSLPTEQAGGPIGSGAAARLLDHSLPPFRLSFSRPSPRFLCSRLPTPPSILGEWLSPVSSLPTRAFLGFMG